MTCFLPISLAEESISPFIVLNHSREKQIMLIMLRITNVEVKMLKLVLTWL